MNIFPHGQLILSVIIMSHTSFRLRIVIHSKCGFTLKLVRNMIITYSQMPRTDKISNG